MQYMGGKGRVASAVARVILDHKGDANTYIEPFLGAGFVFHRVAPHFQNRMASDIMPDLVLLRKALLDGWEPPDALTRAEYAALRHAEPSALRAFAGFGCSFGGKWFGGYASNLRGRDFCGVAKRGLRKKVAGMSGASVEQADYRVYAPGSDAVVYCDPPYAGTTPYGGQEAWCSEEFWRTAEAWARSGATVLVSEYAAPDGWRPVWSAPVKQSLRKDSNVATAVEHLFMLEKD